MFGRCSVGYSGSLGDDSFLSDSRPAFIISSRAPNCVTYLLSLPFVESWWKTVFLVQLIRVKTTCASRVRSRFTPLNVTYNKSVKVVTSKRKNYSLQNFTRIGTNALLFSSKCTRIRATEQNILRIHLFGGRFLFTCRVRWRDSRRVLTGDLRLSSLRSIVVRSKLTVFSISTKHIQLQTIVFWRLLCFVLFTRERETTFRVYYIALRSTEHI